MIEKWLLKWRICYIQYKLEKKIEYLLGEMEKAAKQYFLFKEAPAPWRKKADDAAWGLQVGLDGIKSALPMCRKNFQNRTILCLRIIMAQI
ncbi:MAG: hypothetical protein ABH837_01850 [bacterium]